MSAALIQIATPEQRAAEQQAFREQRRTGIGGSDIASVFSLEPYGCARRLFYEKTATPPDYAPKNEALFERGHELEPVIVAKYLRETGYVGEQHKETIRHKQHAELFVHLDQLIYRNHAPDDGGVTLQGGVLECKTANREIFARIKKQGIPNGYALQLQHAMHCTGLKWGAFAVLWPDGWQMLHWEVEYDYEIGKMIEDEALAFWASVQANEPPERLSPRDKRCKACEFRTSCQGAAMLEGVEDTGNDDVPYLDLDLSDYFELKEIADEADSLFEAEKERLRVALGNHAAADAPGARIYFRPSERSTVDGKALAAKYDELRKWVTGIIPADPAYRQQFEKSYPLAGAFTKTSVVRALRVYPK